MSNQPFRFLHASDLHLERPPSGLGEIPEHLHDALVDAPYRAAATMFAAAIDQRVDFVVLSGDVLDPHTTGLRGPLFLLEQFEKLAARKISVYWAGGAVDLPDEWPPSLPLPPHVRVFPSSRPEEFIERRHEAPLARLIGLSNPQSYARTNEFWREPTGLFSIAVTYGETDAESAARRDIHYWALGGLHERTTLSHAPQTIHYPGTTQGRTRGEAGPHGASIVNVDGDGRVRISFLPTDAVRWHVETIAASVTTSRESLLAAMHERLRQHLSAANGAALLFDWTVTGVGPFVTALRRGNVAAEILRELREEYGFGTPAAWSASLDVEPSVELPAAWYEQETILGDFLRAIRQRETGDEPLDVLSQLDERQRTGELAELVAVTDADTQRRVWREAALLGADLLGGEETQRVHITELEIDGFGAWHGLRMDELAPGLNVVYGPNEAGKTTLMQFVRSMLYGFAPERRARYLPPARGGRAGGWLEVATPAGKFRVSRHDEGTAAGGVIGKLTLTTTDGLPQNEQVLPALLSDVDEAVFNNVFAVGLHEIQELGVLNDTAAASLLYRLTAGLDRVSLVEVMESLDVSRRRLLGGDDKPAQIAQLLAERNKLRNQIDHLVQEARRFAFQTRGCDELDQDIARLELEKKLETQSAVIEAAISVRDKWLQRRHLEDQITALGDVATLPADAVQRLDKLDGAIRLRRREKVALRQDRAKLRGELQSHAATLTLLKQAPRIEMLAEQQPWIETLESQIAELDGETAELESDLRHKRKLIGQEEDKKSTAAPLSDKTLGTLQASARSVVAAHRHLKEAHAARARVRQVAGQLEQQIGASLTDSEGNDLTTAIEEASRQVNVLRRRAQVDERLASLHRNQKELQRESVTLLEREILPPWVLTTLGGMFVSGFVFVLAGLVVPKSSLGPFGWTLAIVGALGAAVALVTKWILESDAARKFDDCQQQLDLLKSQIKQVEDERDVADQQLPPGGGPILARLQQSESKLAKLEELVTVESRRKSARHEADVSKHKLNELAATVRAARERWRQALAIAGLPADTAPKQLRQLADRQTHTADAERRLESLRADRAARHKELAALTARVAQVFNDVGMRPASSHPIAQLQQLRQELAEQQAQVQRRRETLGQVKRLRRRQQKLRQEMKRLASQRHKLLRAARVTDDAEFRRLSLQAARSEQLRRERDALSQDIARLLGPRCSPDAVAEHLDVRFDLPLERRWEDFAARAQTTDTELKQCYEARGLRKQELKTLAEDRRLVERQLELSTVETRLAAAVERWRTLSATSEVLRDVRRAYESERQPEALREASDYLRRLTNGHYARIWIPLGESGLRVDDAAGESLSVEVLSRGAREQVYLSLRLALVACYARRGARLPLILDDVFVNFDMPRARAAAEVMRDFAAAGHQLFIFTCHEHIAEIFQGLEIPVRELGGALLPTIRAGSVVEEIPARSRRKPRRAPQSEPVAIVAEPESSEFDEPVLEVEAEAVPSEVEALLRPVPEPRRAAPRGERFAMKALTPKPPPPKSALPEPPLAPPAFDVRDVLPPTPMTRSVRIDRAVEEPRRERRPQRLIHQRRRFTWEGPPAMPRSEEEDDWDDASAA